MAHMISPLRYPGGKTRLFRLVSAILQANNLARKHYAEPFAGGCGLALALLYGGCVSDIHINDIDPSIWAFWESVLGKNDDLVDLIAKTPVTVDEWLRQRDIYRRQNLLEPLALGFATFFLNRTNRSGIIKDGGVIGGLSQKGNYRIDCRFNRNDLIRRVRRVAKYRKRIHLYRLDALDFLSEVQKFLPLSSFFCMDPPYFNKSSGLYANFYKPSDHQALADRVLELENAWIVTYDKTVEIMELYRNHCQFEFDVNYSVRTKRHSTELLIAPRRLNIPKDMLLCCRDI